MLNVELAWRFAFLPLALVPSDSIAGLSQARMSIQHSTFNIELSIPAYYFL